MDRPGEPAEDPPTRPVWSPLAAARRRPGAAGALHDCQCASSLGSLRVRLSTSSAHWQAPAGHLCHGGTSSTVLSTQPGPGACRLLVVLRPAGRRWLVRRAVGARGVGGDSDSDCRRLSPSLEAGARRPGGARVPNHHHHPHGILPFVDPVDEPARPSERPHFHHTLLCCTVAVSSRSGGSDCGAYERSAGGPDGLPDHQRR